MWLVFLDNQARFSPDISYTLTYVEHTPTILQMPKNLYLIKKNASLLLFGNAGSFCNFVDVFDNVDFFCYFVAWHSRRGAGQSFLI